MFVNSGGKMPAEYLSREERDHLNQQLKEEFNITLPQARYFKTGKEKIRIFTGNLPPEMLNQLLRNTVVEIIGLYFAKEEKNDIVRLSLDASHLLGNQATKNILQLTPEQTQKWLKGEDIEIAQEHHGIFVIRQGVDFLGCGKASQGKLINFIPKERRIR